MTDESLERAFERRTPMRPVQVELACGLEGCDGVLVYTGQAVTQLRTTYQHKCEVCRRMAWFDQRYPHIEHEPADA